MLAMDSNFNMAFREWVSTMSLVYKSVSGFDPAANGSLLLLFPKLHPKEGIRVGLTNGFSGLGSFFGKVN